MKSPSSTRQSSRVRVADRATTRHGVKQLPASPTRSFIKVPPLQMSERC